MLGPRTVHTIVALVLLVATSSAQCLWHGDFGVNAAHLTINGCQPEVVDPVNHVVPLNANDTMNVRINANMTFGFILLAGNALLCNVFPSGPVTQQIDVQGGVMLDGVNPASGLGSPIFNSLAKTPFLLSVAPNVPNTDIAFQAVYFTPTVPMTMTFPMETTAAGIAGFSSLFVTNYDDMGDDDARLHGLIVTPGGVDPLCVGPFNSFFLGSNGQITFNAASTDFTPTAAEFFAGFQPGPTASPNPAIGVLWSNLNNGGGPAFPGSPNGPVVVTEDVNTGDVTVEYQSQTYSSSLDSAGDVTLTFKQTGGFTLDYTTTLVGIASTESILVGWTDGDDQTGFDTDLTGAGGFNGLIGPPYVSPGPGESIAEVIAPNTLLGFIGIDVTPFGPAQYVVNVF